MVSLFLAFLLASVTSENPKNTDYAAAYQAAMTDKKPLMVVVGADWCPACNVLKNSTIQPMMLTGDLDDVSVAVVDRDAEPDLANQLTKGEKMLPQIIVFTPTDNGRWERSKLTGYQPKQPVRNLIRRAVSRLRG
jgi:thioredoxin-like negative regulator of GroEL